MLRAPGYRQRAQTCLQPAACPGPSALSLAGLGGPEGFVSTASMHVAMMGELGAGLLASLVEPLLYAAPASFRV